MRLERREAERLDEARLADDVGSRDPVRDRPRGRRGPATRIPAGPRAPRAAGRRRRTRASPRRGARTRARAGGRSCAPSASRAQRNAVPSAAQPSSRAGRLGVARARSASRSTPQSITSVLPACRRAPPPRAGRAATSETATTAAARRTTCRVARAHARDRSDVLDVLAVRGDDERGARRRAPPRGRRGRGSARRRRRDGSGAPSRATSRSEREMAHPRRRARSTTARSSS